MLDMLLGAKTTEAALSMFKMLKQIQAMFPVCDQQLLWRGGICPRIFLKCKDIKIFKASFDNPTAIKSSLDKLEKIIAVVSKEKSVNSKVKMFDTPSFITVRNIITICWHSPIWSAYSRKNSNITSLSRVIL
jgi:hypothetical protein